VPLPPTMGGVVFPGPGAGGNFLEQILGDLLQLMGGSSPGGARIELARTLAQGVASGGEPERNVDPADRMKFEELAHIAEMHVAELTGLPITSSGTTLEISAVSPGAWAWQTVEDWRFLLEAMGEAPPGPAGDEPGAGDTRDDRDRPAAKGPLGYIGPSGDISGASGSDPDFLPDAEQGPAELLARWMATMGPMLAAMQLGSAVGHLARSTMGPYELPIPRSAPRLLVVPANATRFAEEWSLTPDEVRLWVCLREVTVHAVLSRPHVAQRMRELLVRVVQGMAEDTAGLVDNLQGVDLTQPEALQGLLGDPTALMSLEPSPRRKRAAEDLLAVVAALLGYVEHVLDLAAARLLGGRGAIAEAWRRRQVDRDSPERAAELMLGLDLGPAQIDRGASFVRGVFERAGDEGLARLWSGPHTLPTPAEVDAPGLWLERIDLTETDGSDG
jgi:putative hydrolase